MRGLQRRFALPLLDSAAYAAPYQAFLETMNVFDDPLGHRPDPERAAQELQQLEAVAASPVTLLEKCRLVWGIMKGEAEPRVSPPEIRMEAGSLAGAGRNL